MNWIFALNWWMLVIITSGLAMQLAKGQNNFKRELISCSSYSTGGTCVNDNEGAWLNSAGGTDNGYSLVNQAYDDTNEQTNCYNSYSSYNNINIDLYENTSIEFNHTSTGTAALADCEWLVILSSQFDAEIRVYRADENYEEISVKGIQDKGYSLATNKQVTNGDGTVSYDTMDAVTNLIIRAKILDSQSRYNIIVNLTQVEEDSSVTGKIFAIILFLISAVVIVIATVIFMIICLKKRGQHLQTQETLKYHSRQV